MRGEADGGVGDRVRPGAHGRVGRRAPRARDLRPDRRERVLLLVRARLLAPAARPGGGGAVQQRRLRHSPHGRGQGGRDQDGRPLAPRAESARGARTRSAEWFSSNYALYGDMSRRMYQVLADRVPRVEPYSHRRDVPRHGRARRRAGPGARVARGRAPRAKIPTCVGVGPTKTHRQARQRAGEGRPGPRRRVRPAGRAGAGALVRAAARVGGVGHRPAHDRQAGGARDRHRGPLPRHAPSARRGTC